jgi:hypothetical protein
MVGVLRRSRARAGAVLVWSIALAAACGGGGGEASEDSDGANGSAGTEADPAGTTGGETAASAPPTSEADGGHEELAELLGAALVVSANGPDFHAEPACFDAAVDGASPAARGVADRVEEGSATWDDLTGDERQLLARLFFGCQELESVVFALAVETIGSPDALECIRGAWREAGVTTEVIADSLSFGTALDDLPGDLVDRMVAGAAECEADASWWADDIAIELSEQFGLEGGEAQCVGDAYMSVLGIETVIRRRVLTLPVLYLPPADQAALDLSARCGVEVEWPSPGLLAAPADCVVGFHDGIPTVVPCEQPHDVEILAVQDVTDVVPSWPGAQALFEHNLGFCAEDLEQALGDSTEYVGYTYQPSRYQWEGGVRQVVCAIGTQSGTWTGRSGLVPTPATPTPFEALVPGQCVLDPGLVDGDTGDGVVDVVACAVPHDVEVFFAGDLPDPPGAPYPGDKALSDLTSTQCYPAFESYVDRLWAESRFGWWFIWPSEASWNAGSRRMTCYLHDGGTDLTESKAGSGE